MACPARWREHHRRYLWQHATGYVPGTTEGFLDSVAGFAEHVFSNWAVDPSSVEGLHETYDLPNRMVSHATVDHGLPPNVLALSGAQLYRLCR